MFKILMICQYLHPGGLERMVQNLGTQLNLENHGLVSVFVYDTIPGQIELDDDFRRSGIPVFRQNKPPRFSIRTVLNLLKLACQTRSRILHTHDLGTLIYAVFARFMSLGFLRIVHTQHSFVHLKKKQGSRYRLYEKIFARLANQVVCVSEGLLPYYEALNIPTDKIHVIDNGVAFSFLPATLEQRSQLRKSLLSGASGSSNDTLWLLALARIHTGKGQDHLLDIWRKLTDSTRSHCVLLIVGPETDAEFAKTLRAHPMATHPSVRWLGFSSLPSSWLAACDGFVSGSEFEGLPLSALEAAGMGVPVFLSKIEGHTRFFQQAQFFSYTNPTESALLLEKWIHQLHEQTYSPSTRWSASAPFRERYGIQRMANAYYKVYALC